MNWVDNIVWTEKEDESTNAMVITGQIGFKACRAIDKTFYNIAQTEMKDQTQRDIINIFEKELFDKDKLSIKLHTLKYKTYLKNPVTMQTIDVVELIEDIEKIVNSCWRSKNERDSDI